MTWELYLELDDQVTVLVGLLVERHTKVFNDMQLIGLNNFTNIVLNSNLSVIKMSQDEIKTG